MVKFHRLGKLLASLLPVGLNFVPVCQLRETTGSIQREVGSSFPQWWDAKEWPGANMMVEEAWQAGRREGVNLEPR